MSDDFRTRSRNAWADAVKGWEPMPQEGAAPSPALTREALAAALDSIGYPPIKAVSSNAGPSSHFRHDNEAYADAILAALGTPPPTPTSTREETQ